MSRAQKMFTPKEKSLLPDKKNFDGFPAFSVGIHEQYVQMCMVNTIGNTYYMSGNDLYDYSLALHDKMLKTDPEFMMKTLVYARNAGLMRMQPVVGLAFLSKHNNKSYFHTAFKKVIKTPQDLMDFVAIASSVRNNTPGEHLGRSVKRAINNWLTGEGYEFRREGLSQYHAIKYGGEGTKQWSLRNILRVTHPNPGTNKMQSALFNYITKGTIDVSLEQIAAIEALKHVAANKKEHTPAQFAKNVKTLIDGGRLPYEVVTGIIKPDVEIWEHLMRQMPIFALVRHLNTLDEAGVFKKKDNVDYTVGQLTNPEIISRSRMLPFRFSTAYKNYKGVSQISSALKKSLDLSLSNLDMLPGKNAFFLDVSGSMQGDYLEIGSLLGIAAVKKSPDSMFLCFGSDLKYPRIERDESVMNNMEACRKVFGGGTSTSVTINHLLGKAKETRGFFINEGGYDRNFPESAKTTAPVLVDNIVIITDEQQNFGSPVVKVFREYRQKVNKNAKLFIIDIAPYNSRKANQEEPGVTFIYGWSDSVLDILKYSMEGSGRHVDQIKNMKV